MSEFDTNQPPRGRRVIQFRLVPIDPGDDPARLRAIEPAIEHANAVLAEQGGGGKKPPVKLIAAYSPGDEEPDDGSGFGEIPPDAKRDHGLEDKIADEVGESLRRIAAEARSIAQKTPELAGQVVASGVAHSRAGLAYVLKTGKKYAWDRPASGVWQTIREVSDQLTDKSGQGLVYVMQVCCRILVNVFEPAGPGGRDADE